MKCYGRCGTLLLMLSLCGPVSTVWSSDTAASQDALKGNVRQEAVVMKVEGDTVTLRSLADGNAVFTLSGKDVGPLQAGDRVIVDGTSVRKVGTAADPASKPGPAAESPVQSR